MKIKCVFIGLVIFLISCQEKYFDRQNYPRIETTRVEVVSDGVIFTGKFLIEGKTKITDHGFTWSTDFPTIEKSPKTSLGSLDLPGTFTSQVQSGLIKGKKYNVRAYATTDDYVVYGQYLSFSIN
jgi:hypothetical protein